MRGKFTKTDFRMKIVLTTRINIAIPSHIDDNERVLFPLKLVLLTGFGYDLKCGYSKLNLIGRFSQNQSD